VKELEKKKTKLQQRLAHLKKIESNIRQQEERLSQENSYKNRILDGIRKSKKFAMNKLTGLREKGSKLAGSLPDDDDSGVLDLLFRPSFFEQKGQLPQPVAGAIIQGFGLMRDEENNVTLSHKGVFYSVPEGTAVKAVFSGTVAFVGSLPGFGQTLILDHGDHYYTVYSHNKNISVTVGDEVEQNQAVATTGYNPELSRNGVYFEVRHFSEPYDPSSWMKGSL
jgi:septal ring factor EnvC (AmiA/AmiB activator)